MNQNNNKEIKRVGLFVKNKEEAVKLQIDIAHYLKKKKGIETITHPLAATADTDPSILKKVESNCTILPPEHIPSKVDAIIVLGGDGTLLNSTKYLSEIHTPPVLGINLGDLGFMTESKIEETYESIDNLVGGKNIRIQKRMMFDVNIYRKDELTLSRRTLNDVVINKNALARIIDLTIYASDTKVGTIKGDGLIISTPTGSTAYSLAAGGPIVYPTMDCIVYTPICPHSLTNRPMIFSSNDILKVIVESDSQNIYCTLDGQEGVNLLPEDIIIVKKSGVHLNLILSPKRNFFEILRTKLKMGERN